jgi:hypothetical protein
MGPGSENSNQRRKRLHRLSQIVAGRRKEPDFLPMVKGKLGGAVTSPAYRFD